MATLRTARVGSARALPVPLPLAERRRLGVVEAAAGAGVARHESEEALEVSEARSDTMQSAEQRGYETSSCDCRAVQSDPLMRAKRPWKYLNSSKTPKQCAGNDTTPLQNAFFSSVLRCKATPRESA